MAEGELPQRVGPASQSGRWGGRSPWLWFALAWAGLHVVLSFALTAQVPIHDDFDVLRSVNAIDATPEDAWSLLLAPHNEHRIVLTRLVFLGIDRLPVPLLPAIAALGSLALLMIAGTYRRALLGSPGAVQGPRRDLVLATTLLLTFNMTTGENMLFAMASIQNHAAVAIAVLAVYWTLAGGRRLPLAWLAATVASYSTLQGLLVWPVSVVALAVERRWRECFATAAAGALVGLVFLQGYGAAESGVEVATAAPTAIARTLVVATSLVGALVGIPGTEYPVITGVSFVLSLALGTVLVGLMARFHLRGAGASLLGRFALWSGTFGVLSALVIGFGRQSLGLRQGLASRYHLTSIIVVIAVLVLLEVTPGRGTGERRTLPGAGATVTVRTAAALALVSVAFPVYFRLVVFSGAHGSELVHPNPEVVAPIMEESIERGFIAPGAGRPATP